MSITELYERIQSWLWLYNHVPFPLSTDPSVIELNKSVALQWDIEVMLEVAEWDIPTELIGTPVEEDLQKAIAYTRADDRTKIKEIYNLLSTVLKYMTDHWLDSNIITPN